MTRWRSDVNTWMWFCCFQDCIVAYSNIVMLWRCHKPQDSLGSGKITFKCWHQIATMESLWSTHLKFKKYLYNFNIFNVLRIRIQWRMLIIREWFQVQRFKFTLICVKTKNFWKIQNIKFWENPSMNNPLQGVIHSNFEECL